MNDPHENLDRDPFADDAQRRASRLRRPVVRTARRAQRARCADTASAGSAQTIVSRPKPIRHMRPCPDAARAPLR
jgi:hypothetical protein